MPRNVWQHSVSDSHPLASAGGRRVSVSFLHSHFPIFSLSVTFQRSNQSASLSPGHACTRGKGRSALAAAVVAGEDVPREKSGKHEGKRGDGRENNAVKSEVDVMKDRSLALCVCLRASEQ